MEETENIKNINSELRGFQNDTRSSDLSIALYSIRLYFYHQLHPQLGVVFALALSLHSFWSYFSTFLQ